MVTCVTGIVAPPMCSFAHHQQGGHRLVPPARFRGCGAGDSSRHGRARVWDGADRQDAQAPGPRHQSEGAAAAIELFPSRSGTTADLMALTTGRLHQIVGQYAQAAVICRDAGSMASSRTGPTSTCSTSSSCHRQPALRRHGGSFENRCRPRRRNRAAIRAAIGQSLLDPLPHTPWAMATGSTTA